MQAQIERRAHNSPRMLLGVPVELIESDFDEPFEADVIDVGPGGAAMRAAYLPNVGTRLTCRFGLPAADLQVEADGEVVWAEDSGPQSGEFGVRFTRVAEAAVRSIRSLADATRKSACGPWPREI